MSTKTVAKDCFFVESKTKFLNYANLKKSWKAI